MYAPKFRSHLSEEDRFRESQAKRIDAALDAIRRETHDLFQVEIAQLAFSESVPHTLTEQYARWRYMRDLGMCGSDAAFRGLWMTVTN